MSSKKTIRPDCGANERKAKRFKFDENVQKQQESLSKDQCASILVLNDDCLMEVFSHLPTIDLCAVAECCCRFGNLADEIMKERFKKKTIRFYRTQSDSRQANYLPSRTVTMHQSKETESVLKHFGKFISHMWIASESLSKEFWGLLDYCSELKYLNLYCAPLYLSPVADMSDMFECLNKLDLWNCFSLNWGYEKVLRSCKSLKSLSILTVDESVNGPVMADPTDDLLPFIAQHLVGVERLRLWTVNCSDRLIENVTQLKTLKHLKFLSLNCHNQSITPAIEALSAMDSLHSLSLRQFRAVPNDRLAAALDKFSKLYGCIFCGNSSVESAALASTKNFNVKLSDDGNVDLKRKTM